MYDAPIWLRKYTFSKLVNHYESQSKTTTNNNVDKSIQAMKSAGFTAENLNKKHNKPIYTSKASKN
jgi:hypothetical protein